jgi:tellurite resistance protein TerC
MTAIWTWLTSPAFAILAGSHALLVLVLTIDLVVLHRRASAISVREAALGSAFWIALALFFALGIWKCWGLWDPVQPEHGGQKAIEFLTGYLVEQSLSIDNLFVFLVIFRYFGVPEPLRHRVLFWGILGAVVFRATFILAGAALLRTFHWLLYGFGLFLLYTGYKLLHPIDEQIDPSRNPLLRLARLYLPILDDYQSPHFWVRRAGRWYATPLPLVLLVVESTDVVFALDSIPAVFGVTRDPFIVYTSNIFAILGLRSLYFLLAGFLGRFRHLNIGLGLVLMFVGVKMLAEDLVTPYLEARGVDSWEVILITLGVIAGLLAASVLASLIAGPKEPLEKPPEVVEESPGAVPGDAAGSVNQPEGLE